MNLEEIFNQKLTENGDVSYKSTLNPLLDLLFMTEYFQKHVDEVRIGTSAFEKAFAMFVRDPRYGLGKRDLGRELMKQAQVSITDMVLAGRFDDVWTMFHGTAAFNEALDYLKDEIKKGNELAKKWMPRYSSKNLMVAREIAKYWGMNKQQYGKFIKCDTVENKLSRKNTEEIEFEHVPSLALIKYYQRFLKKEDTKARFEKYLADVKDGKKEMKISTTTVYDIYKNRTKIDPDIFFDKIEKISGSWIPVIDSSGSMQDGNDSYGKAIAIGHYLSKCSTYAPNKVVSFSSNPQLLELGVENEVTSYGWGVRTHRQNLSHCKNQYEREIASMYTGDFSSTDFGAVMRLLKGLDAKNAPEWLVVLSDMEFDCGSKQSKDETMRIFHQNGFKTKIVWWNLNSRNKTCPEVDKDGNVFMSGYSPYLLKFLEAGFNGEQFMKKLVAEYVKKVGITIE